MEQEFIQIPSSRLVELQKAHRAYERRCSKLGYEPVKLEVGEKGTIAFPIIFDNGRQVKDLWGKPLSRTFETVNIRFLGNPLKMEGWTFCGRLTPMEKANLFSAVPGEVIPESYRESPLYCDHCNTNRFRKETFIFRHDDGRHIQVGRQCVADYFGNEAYAKMAESLANWMVRICTISTADPYDAGEWGGGGTPELYATDYVLSIACASVRCNGWVSVSAAHLMTASTASNVCAYIWARCKKDMDDTGIEPLECDKERLEEVKQWAKGLSSDNDYERNLRAVINEKYVNPKAMNLLVSAAGVYEIRQAKKVEMESRTNEYFGTVGERIEIKLAVKAVKHIEGYYGVTSLCIMEDSEGRGFQWWSSNGGLDKGLYKIKGTIKRHEEYKGFKKTILTRCKVVEKITGTSGLL